jgi:hypothetical protein
MSRQNVIPVRQPRLRKPKRCVSLPQWRLAFRNHIMEHLFAAYGERLPTGDLFPMGTMRFSAT